AHCPLWVLDKHVGPEAGDRLPLRPLHDWYDRVSRIGHGYPVEMDAAEALEIAARSDPQTPDPACDDDPSGLAVGMEGVVRADDTGRDPVRGILLAADAQELVIRSEHPRVGATSIHFPRAGFDAVRASSA